MPSLIISATARSFSRDWPIPPPRWRSRNTGPFSIRAIAIRDCKVAGRTQSAPESESSGPCLPDRPWKTKWSLFANNQEFQECSREEQELATACKVLIQNGIVLWNALFLPQQLSSIINAEDRQQMLKAITNASLLTWQIVNLQGEYDFRQVVAKDEPFDMRKIMKLKLNQGWSGQTWTSITSNSIT